MRNTTHPRIRTTPDARTEGGFYANLSIHALVAYYQGSQLNQSINDRAALKNRIERYQTSRNTIWVTEEGRDCDGVQYCHSPYEIEASIQAYNREYEHIAKWADGPFRLVIQTESAIKYIEPWSRDLTMESFENGHQHVIYTTIK